MSRDVEGSGSVFQRAQGSESAMTRPRKLTDLISMRLSPEDSDDLDAVCEKIPMPRLTVARIAMRLGLAELRENPARVLETPAKARTRKAKRTR